MPNDIEIIKKLEKKFEAKFSEEELWESIESWERTWGSEKESVCDA